MVLGCLRMSINIGGSVNFRDSRFKFKFMQLLNLLFYGTLGSVLKEYLTIAILAKTRPFEGVVMCF